MKPSTPDRGPYSADDNSIKISRPETDHFQNYLNDVFTVIMYYNFRITRKFRSNSDTHNTSITHTHDLCFAYLTPVNTERFNTLELSSAVPPTIKSSKQDCLDHDTFRILYLGQLMIYGMKLHNLPNTF